MAANIFINGEAAVLVGTGTNFAWEFLGVTVDGVEVVFQPKAVRVDTDTFMGADGPAFDFQYAGNSALIKMQLVYFDEDIFAKIGTGIQGVPFGQVSNLGFLVGRNNSGIPVLIKSPKANRPWRFRRTVLMDQTTIKLGTRRSIYDLTLQAFPYSGTSFYESGNAAITLFDRSEDPVT